MQSLIRIRALFHLLHELVCFASSPLINMNALLEAVHANNECVKLFDDGNIADGLLALRRAYSGLWSAKDPQAADRLFPSETFPSERDCGRQRLSCGLQNGHFYVYDRLVLLPAEVDKSSIAQMGSFDFTVRTSILFNMAVGYHIQGMQWGKGSLLKLSSHLYDVVLAALDDVTDDTDASIRVLKCLTLNNRAQLYFEQMDFDEGMDCIDEMCVLLLSTDPLDNFIDVSDVAEIRRNIKFIQPPLTASAA
jgi:hypothetical protein